MYYDLDLADWTFEIEQTTAKQITDRLLDVTDHYEAALKQVATANAKVKVPYDATFAIMNDKLNA